MNEEDAYCHVPAEVANGELRPSLWAKALAESVGHEKVAQSLYLKFRAQQLLSDYRLAEKDKVKQEFQASITAAKHQTASAVRRGLLLAITVVCGLISLGFGFGMFGVLADTQNGTGGGSALVCLIFALVSGSVAVICGKTLARP